MADASESKDPYSANEPRFQLFTIHYPLLHERLERER
jgi:hypothetical protein